MTDDSTYTRYFSNCIFLIVYGSANKRIYAVMVIFDNSVIYYPNTIAMNNPYKKVVMIKNTVVSYI